MLGLGITLQHPTANLVVQAPLGTSSCNRALLQAMFLSAIFHHFFIGDQAYLNKCSNTTAWLDGDFIEGFATLSYHYSHSSGMPTATNKDLPQLVHVTHPKQTLAADHVKPIPSLVLRLVGILHNNQHYVVLEVDIAERPHQNALYMD
jgi:hypothetical protein